MRCLDGDHLQTGSRPTSTGVPRLLDVRAGTAHHTPAPMKHQPRMETL